jgi:hypothetical protein
MSKFPENAEFCEGISKEKMPKGIEHRILYLGPRINSPRIVTEHMFGGELTAFVIFVR